METQQRVELPHGLAYLQAIPVMYGKLHRAHVTGAKLDYVDQKDRNSITIDPVLLDALGWAPLMQVHVNSCGNGAHWETYIKVGERGKGEIIMNGPPARYFQPGDIIIVVTYGLIRPSDLHLHRPKVIIASQDGKNTIDQVLEEEAFQGWLVDKGSDGADTDSRT